MPNYLTLQVAIIYLAAVIHNHLVSVTQYMGIDVCESQNRKSKLTRYTAAAALDGTLHPTALLRWLARLNWKISVVSFYREKKTRIRTIFQKPHPRLCVID